MKRFRRSLKKAGRSAASFQDITWSSKLNALPYNHNNLNHHGIVISGGSYTAISEQHQQQEDHKLATTQLWTSQRGGGFEGQRSDLPLLHGSQTSVAESGIASEMSTTMESHRSATLRAPTTPHAIRQKPPPKPPRLQSVHSVPNDSYSSPNSPVSMYPPSSPGAYSSKSSFGDITGTMDSSFSSSFHRSATDVQPISRVYPISAEDKVFHIVLQTKEFLVNEIDAESLLMPLQDKGVLDPRAVSELLRTTTTNPKTTAMGQLLLDMLMGKSRREFLNFCDILRHYGKCPHLADVLLALDCLVDLGSEDAVKKRQGNAASKEDGDLLQEAGGCCPMCGGNGNSNNPGDNNVDVVDDFLTDTTNFDVEIVYIDRETGQVRSQKEVAGLKLDKLFLSAGRINNKVPEDLVKHEADRYIPVITCSLYNYCLWDAGMEKICRALSRKSCIRELCLSKCHLGPVSIRHLSHSIQQTTGVHKVDLRLNTLSHECLVEFAEGLKKNTSVKVINLSSTELTAEGCRILLQGICRNQSTSDLDIGFNDLTNIGSEVIARAIATNCPLKRLRIRDNGITFDGAFRLFKALKKNSRLTFLDISSNNIGNRSMVTLSEILRYNRTLKQLNLENCRISRDGCQMLARALKTNTVLRLLNLSMNPIGDQGVEGLAQGLKYNQVLDTLCLNMCNISNLGFAKLLDSLQFNMSLKTLKLCYNRICRLCERCSSISSDYNQNDFTTEDYVIMEEIHFVNSDSDNNTDDKVNGNEGITTTVPGIEEVYEKLCQILQQNKDLKVLLWGNKLDEEGSSCHGDLHDNSNHSNGKFGDLNACTAGDRRSAVSEPADLQSSLYCTTTVPTMLTQQQRQFPETTSLTLTSDVILCKLKNRDNTQQKVLDKELDNKNNHVTTNGSAPAHLNQMQRAFVEQYTIHGVQPFQKGSEDTVKSRPNGYQPTAVPSSVVDQSQLGILSVTIPNTHSHTHLGQPRPQISPRMGTTAPLVFNATNKIPPPPILMHQHRHLTQAENFLTIGGTDFAAAAATIHHPRIRTNGSLPRRKKQTNNNKVLWNGDIPHVAQCLPEEEEGGEGEQVGGDGGGEFKPHTFPRRVPHRTTPV